MWVRPLGQEDPLMEGMATHYSILAWRIPWTEEPGGLQSMGSQRVRHNWASNTVWCSLAVEKQFHRITSVGQGQSKPTMVKEKKKTKTIALSSQNVNKNTHILQTTKCPNMPLFLVNMNDCSFFTDYSSPLTSCLSRRLHENAQWYSNLCLLIASSSKPSPTFSSPSLKSPKRKPVLCSNSSGRRPRLPKMSGLPGCSESVKPPTVICSYFFVWSLTGRCLYYHDSLMLCSTLLEDFQFSSVAQLCPTLCDPMDCSTPGLPELAQTHVHRVSDVIQPSHPLSSPSSFAFNHSQHQGLWGK